MTGRDWAHDAWTKEAREAHLARRRQVKGELSLAPATGATDAIRSLDPPRSGWASRIAAMLPTLRRLVLGAA